MHQKVIGGDGTLILWESEHFIVWESDHLPSGNRTAYHLGSGTFSWETGHSILLERFYPMGIGPLILWDSGHPLRNGTWETGHAIPWESDHLFSGKYPLGIGPLILWNISSGNREFGR